MKSPDWRGETCVIVCAGPSLGDDQFDVVEKSKAKVLAVNCAYLYTGKRADVVYAGDYLFWKVHHARIVAQCPQAQLWSCDTSAASRFRGVNRARYADRPGLGLSLVHVNGNSGFAALNLAFLWGCRRVLVIGMDMQLGPNGEKHRHGDHEKPLVQSQLFSEWLHKSNPFAADLKAEGCEVVNCTPGSALTVFPMSTVEEELR